MVEPQPRITMRLDRALTKREKAKLAATKAGRATLSKIKHVSEKYGPKVKAALVKHGPTAKRAAVTVAKGLGSAAWELFKTTKAGKKIARKAAKGKKIYRKSRRKAGFHKECKWVRN